jgi:hypothetical protein
MKRIGTYGLVALATLAGSVHAQSSSDVVFVTNTVPSASAVPFGPGESARYQVKLGLFGDVGEGRLLVPAIETIRGHQTYHLRMTLKGGIPFAKVDTKYESWLDVDQLFSRRFHQDQHEVRYERKRTFDFYPEERRWETTTGKTGELPTDMPLDDLSFLFFARTLPLEVGKEYRFNRYFQDDGNPVRLKVLRTETVQVPAGTFETIVVQPIIKSKGIFSEGGEAEVYFTNDANRVLVMLKSKVKILRSLDMLLEEYTPGAPMSATAVSGH